MVGRSKNGPKNGITFLRKGKLFSGFRATLFEIMHIRGSAPGEIHSEKGSSKLRVLIQAGVKDVRIHV